MNKTIAIIGAGPAGLMAADILSAADCRVTVYDRMPSPARKFLMAGRGGLNLTHSEPFERFVTRYGKRKPHLRPALEAFPPSTLRAWADALGAQTFTGSSGRVFPKAMKASPLLRAWLQRLEAQGVRLEARSHWQGWDDQGRLLINGTPVEADATVLALGGASWPRLGSDGGWVGCLRDRGVTVAPFQPANAGFSAEWSESFRRFAGQPLKTIAVTFDGRTIKGELMITQAGLEGGAIYALSGPLRDAIARDGHADLLIDLKPDLSAGQVISKLGRASPKDSMSNRLRKALGLTPPAIALMFETGAADAKAIPVRLTGTQRLERAISSAGGVAFDSLTPDFELKALPGVYGVGEMLDWEAPTGGYLLQACFSTAAVAARAILRA